MKVTIEVVQPDDPEYGTYACSFVAQPGCDESAYEQLVADLRTGLSLRDLLEANPDALTSGRQFRVTVHHDCPLMDSVPLDSVPYGPYCAGNSLPEDEVVRALRESRGSVATLP